MILSEVNNVDSESRGNGSLIQTDSVLLEFLAQLPVDCLDAKGNVIVMYLNQDAVDETWERVSGGGDDVIHESH